MQSDLSMRQSHASTWSWFALALLLALAIFWVLSDELRLRLELYLFIPLLTGWLASRFGFQLVPFLLALAAITVFSVGERLFSTLSISFGIPLWIYILAVFTALAFARPRWHMGLTQVFEARWRWLRWLLLIALWMAVFKDHDLLWKLSNSFRIGVNPGFVLLVLVLAASIKWSVFYQWLQREYWQRDHVLRGILTMGVIVLLVLGLLLNFRWTVFAGLSIGFGFKSADGLVPVIAFLLAVFAILDWRLILMLLSVFFASEVAVSWLGEMFAALSNGEVISSGSLSLTYINWVGLIRGITAVLLGIAIAPFWRDQDPASLRIKRTRLFLILALVVLFFGMPDYSRSIGSTGLMLVGCAAYIMGLTWQVRGAIAGPLLIQMLYLLSQIVGCIDDSCHSNAYELVNIAFVTFVFGFFGLLSNRYQAHPPLLNESGEKEGMP